MYNRSLTLRKFAESISRVGSYQLQFTLSSALNK